MNRIDRLFEKLRQSGRKALMPYITAGDPRSSVTVPLMHAMVRAGADAIELGVPFSDPMADGPVIQRAAERALAAGMTLRRVLEMVAEFRREDSETPVVLMGYLNPVEAMGYEEFATAARKAGVDGALTVDMPPEEAGELCAALEAAGLHPIFLVAPNSGAERLRAIGAAGRGFLYHVSLKGVTGAAHLDVAAVERKVADMRAQTGLPIAVGFGIRDAESAAGIARIADGVVVGSALVRLIEENCTASDEAVIAAVAESLGTMRSAMDASTTQA
jgi:tryptophan synthase alpha chain